MIRSLFQKALWDLAHTESSGEATTAWNDSSRWQSSCRSAGSGTECVSTHHATSPAAQTANCALDATSAWHCPWVLSRANEPRASATMRWICWCLARGLCTVCQAEAPRALLPCVAETCCQPHRSMYHRLCTESGKGFLASPEVPLAQQECGCPHPPYSSDVTG